MRAEPLFRQVLERCDAIVKQLLGWSLIQELERPLETSRYNQTEELFEPTLAAVSIAQVEVWRQRGIVADAVMGLSGGEFTAAYTAGVLNLEETLQITCQWSRFLREQRVTPGGMVWVNVDWAQATKLQHDLDLEIYPAVEWSPSGTNFSGPMPAIEALSTHLDRIDIRYQRLQTDFSYHNEHSFIDADDFIGALHGLRPKLPTMPIYSAWAGGLLHDATFDARHWCQMISSPALVVRAFHKIFQDGYAQVLDVGLTSKTFFEIQDMARPFQQPVDVMPSLSCIQANARPFTQRPLRIYVFKSLFKRV